LPAGLTTVGATGTTAVAGDRSEFAPTVLAVRPHHQWWRRRQRRFSAVAAVVVALGRLQEMVTTWRPAAWLNTTRALRPLAIQRSYSTEKSAVETAGCGVGQTGPSTLAHTPPLTTLTHIAVGEAREVGGRGET
jgi:hypothetical protein